MDTQREFIGLVGLGGWGKNILKNLNEMGVLYAACDSDIETVTERKRQFPAVRYVVSFEDILREPTVRAVVIATPAATHYEFAKQSLLAGKDVFVEKPLALTAREGEELVELAERSGRVLMVGHILLYHPAVIKLKELISTGQIGEVRYFYCNRLNIGKLRTEENILWSFAPHDISLILWLLEKEPLKVSAFGGSYVYGNNCDTMVTTLDFPGAVKGHIFVSWLHPYKEQKVIVVGSRAMAVFDDMTEEKLFLYPHKIAWKNGKIPVAHKADCSVIPVEKSEPLRQELSHFIESVLKRERPRTDGREGLKVLKVLSAAEHDLSGIKFRRSDLTAVNGYFVHESAYIDDDVRIGEGTKIWHFSHVLRGASIGADSILGQNVMVGPGATVGDRCKIQNNVSIYKGVTIEDEVFCGPSCVFTNVYNPRAFIERKNEFKETIVKKGATVGANATIVCGVTIGENAMVGAGAVVKSNVPDHAIVAGVPAKHIGWACRCGTTLSFNDGHAHCDYCGRMYGLEGNSLTTGKQRATS